MRYTGANAFAVGFKKSKLNDKDYERRSIGQCGKIMFSKKDAATKRNLLTKMGRERHLRIYQCDDCKGGWHLTKTTLWTREGTEGRNY